MLVRIEGIEGIDRTGGKRQATNEKNKHKGNNMVLFLTPYNQKMGNSLRCEMWRKPPIDQLVGCGGVAIARPSPKPSIWPCHGFQGARSTTGERQKPLVARQKVSQRSDYCCTSERLPSTLAPLGTILVVDRKKNASSNPAVEQQVGGRATSRRSCNRCCGFFTETYNYAAKWCQSMPLTCSSR